MDVGKSHEIAFSMTVQRIFQCQSLKSSLRHTLFFFKYSMFSDPGDIIGNFTTFEACPLDALNAHSFIRELRISVWNASNCHKMISLNNYI